MTIGDNFNLELKGGQSDWKLSNGTLRTGTSIARTVRGHIYLGQPNLKLFWFDQKSWDSPIEDESKAQIWLSQSHLMGHKSLKQLGLGQKS